MMLILLLKLLLVFSLLLILLDEPPAFLELFLDLLLDFFVPREQLKHFLLIFLGFLDDRQEEQQT
jgi:hypothetical protein